MLLFPTLRRSEKLPATVTVTSATTPVFVHMYMHMAVGTPASDPPSASDGEKLALWRAQIAEDDSDDGDHPPPPPAPPRRTGPHSASGGGSGSGGGETEYLQRKVAVLQLQLEEKDLELQEARMQAQWVRAGCGSVGMLAHRATQPRPSRLQTSAPRLRASRRPRLRSGMASQRRRERTR